MTENKVLTTIPISKEMELALKIDTFMNEFDPYEYNDKIENTENHIKELVENLKMGNTKQIKEYLVDINFSDHPHESLNAKQIIEEIYKYEMHNYPRELAYRINNKYLAIHDCNDGFDYTFYDKNYNLLDGGIYDDIEINIYEAIHEVAEFENGFSIWNRENVEQVDFEELTEHSLSVSGISSTNSNNTVIYSDVEPIGFKKLEQFNPLNSSELSIEQNSNMIDGIINNQPIVTELDQPCKTGHPLSIMDILDVIKNAQKKQKTKPKEHTRIKSVEMDR